MSSEPKLVPKSSRTTGKLRQKYFEASTPLTIYRTFFPEGITKPFISYDERPHLFSFTCDRTDTTAVTDFFASMKGYVDIFEKKGSADYVDSSPKMKARTGTIIEDPLILHDNETTGEDLLGIGDDVDSDVEDAGPGHSNQYWTPRFGDSHMLTRDIGMGVTEATEASLYPEHDRNRVTIMGGNANEALSKLTTLEPLMVCHTPLLEGLPASFNKNM
jgi:hypothetical protein